MAKTMQWYLDKYGESHQNDTNKLIHWICVPAIMFSLLGLLYQIPFPLAEEQSLFVLFRKPISPVKKRPNVPTLAPVATIGGPWQVAFDPAWGGPASTTFERLSDWTTHPEPGIRYYSGRATYRKTFTAPRIDGPVFLDLGLVESLCEVRVNGKHLGVLWSKPFQVDISDALKPGENLLEVEVINLWCNRLIGDIPLPESERLTQTNITRLKADEKLAPSGLLGPVVLRAPVAE